MQKKAKNLLLIFILIIVGVPSIYFRINVMIQNEMNNVEISITNVSIKDMNESNMNLTADFGIESELDVGVRFIINDTKLLYDNKELGTIEIIDNNFTSDIASYSEKELHILITNNAVFNSFLTNYINFASVSLNISGEIQFENNSIPLENYIFSKKVSFDGLNGLPGMIEASVEMIDISVNPEYPTTSSINMNTTVIINNPTDFHFEIINFTGDLKFDDEDGYFELPIINLSRQYGIILDELELDWSNSPIELFPSGCCQKNQSLQSSQLDNVTLRVYDEYYNKNDLRCYISNGIATIKLFDFQITVSNLSVSKFKIENFVQIGDSLTMYYELWVMDESTQTLDQLQSGLFECTLKQTSEESNLIYGYWKHLEGLRQGNRIDFWVDACIDDGQLIAGDMGSIHPDSIAGDGWDDRYPPGEVRAESYGCSKPTTSQTTGKSYNLRNTDIRFIVEITHITRI